MDPPGATGAPILATSRAAIADGGRAPCLAVGPGAAEKEVALLSLGGT